MSVNFLNDIIAHKRKVNAEKKEYYFSLRRSLEKTQYTRYHLFKKQISRPGINLIAEVKKASPSKGLIRSDFDALAIARIYCEHKAAAISVLTEDKYFLGKTGYVKQISDNVDLPILTKDFTIDEGQIFEARHTGSSAVLLIMAILSDEEVKRFKKCADQLDLDCLVEIHDEKELDRALACGAEIVGINNRNLTTFHVDMSTCDRLIPRIPKDKVIVAESGINAHEQIVQLKNLGANAVLIGETFMREANIGAKIDEIMGW